MRHGIAGKKLSRNQSLRKATVRDLAIATLKRQSIQTTKTKAKEARKLVDKLITLGKKGTLAHKRKAFSILCDHQLVSHLFNDMAPRFKDRQGGYTRVIGMVNRRGDNAEMALLQLTEIEKVLVNKPISKVGKEKQTVVDGDVPVKNPVESKQKSIKKTDLDSKQKPKGNVVGGIKKIFNRKTATEK